MNLKKITAIILSIFLVAQAFLPIGGLLICFEPDGDIHVEITLDAPDHCNQPVHDDLVLCKEGCSDSVIQNLDTGRTDNQIVLAHVPALVNHSTGVLLEVPLIESHINESPARAPTITHLKTVVIII